MIRKRFGPFTVFAGISVPMIGPLTERRIVKTIKKVILMVVGFHIAIILMFLLNLIFMNVILWTN